MEMPVMNGYEATTYIRDKMNNKIEAYVKRDNGLCTFLADNATAYTGDAAFEDVVEKQAADYALTVTAAAATTADNTGYSVEKVNAKYAGSIMASEMCASSQVKLDMLGKIVISQSLNSSFSFFYNCSDVLSASRMQNVHDVIETNIVINKLNI